jgi:hypothetical protein
MEGNQKREGDHGKREELGEKSTHSNHASTCLFRMLQKITYIKEIENAKTSGFLPAGHSVELHEAGC